VSPKTDKPGGRRSVLAARQIRSDARDKRRRQRERRAHARLFEFMAGWR
jgi:hypothetical protein